MAKAETRIPFFPLAEGTIVFCVTLLSTKEQFFSNLDLFGMPYLLDVSTEA